MSMPTQDQPQLLEPAPRIITQKIIWPILLMMLIGALIVMLDGRKIQDALGQADWRPILPALAFTVLSYLCVSYTYAMIARMWGIHMSRRDLAEICFVTTSLNHVVRSGGVAGYSVRYLLMNQHGVPFTEVISSSLMHFYITSLDMITMLPVAIVYLLYNIDLPRSLALPLAGMTLVFMLIAIGSTMFIFSNDLRLRLIEFTIRLGKRILQRDFDALLCDFDDHMSNGVAILRRQAPRSGVILFLTFIDWCASVVVLYQCFNAFGPALKPGAVIASFMIGIMAGVISALPGGIGVQEGSMTGISMLLGAAFEQAVLAALLFRMIYYFVPYAISLLFYWRLLHQQPGPNYAD